MEVLGGLEHASNHFAPRSLCKHSISNTAYHFQTQHIKHIISNTTKHVPMAFALKPSQTGISPCQPSLL
eukprot:4023919-Alexandrium_andersonii.AAC.1